MNSTNQPGFNKDDHQQWETIFNNVPIEWKTHPPTEHQDDCIKFLKKNRANTVLDSGCGIGRWAIHAAKNGFSTSGYDFSENAIKYAKDWANIEKLKISFEVCGLTNDPFPNKTFDALISAMVIHNVSENEAEESLQLLYNKLVTEGVFYMLVNPFLTPELEKIQENSDNPTKGITQINYSDQELLDLASQYSVIDFKHYEDGTRGLFLRK